MASNPWRRIQVLTLVSGGVPSAITLILIWVAPGLVQDSPAMRWTLTTGVLATWLVCGLLAREGIVERLRTFTNILSAIRERDYTVRATGTRGDDPLSEIATELNELGDHLRARRLERKETDALLAKVLEEIDAGIFTFDGKRRLRLVNRKGVQWLARPADQLIGVSSRILGLDDCLEGDVPRVVEMAFPGGTGRYEISRRTFREGGQPHMLLVIADLSRALAAEERLAWKRLIQVLRHEINNSLAPIQSLASTLTSKLGRDPKPDGWEFDLKQGLEVIGSRSESLARLTAAYAKLTRLPPPSPKQIDLTECIERVVALENRLEIDVVVGAPLKLMADADQLEQALINLARNAVDAALETKGGVRVSWQRDASNPQVVAIRIEDDGPGLSGSENLFVPFFTTKSGGSGIGLVLSRHIVQAHGGHLALADRPGGTGCRVTIRLPLEGPT